MTGIYILISMEMKSDTTNRIWYENSIRRFSEYLKMTLSLLFVVRINDIGQIAEEEIENAIILVQLFCKQTWLSWLGTKV